MNPNKMVYTQQCTTITHYMVNRKPIVLKTQLFVCRNHYFLNQEKLKLKQIKFFNNSIITGNVPG